MTAFCWQPLSSTAATLTKTSVCNFVVTAERCEGSNYSQCGPRLTWRFASFRQHANLSGTIVSLLWKLGSRKFPKRLRVRLGIVRLMTTHWSHRFHSAWILTVTIRKPSSDLFALRNITRRALWWSREAKARRQGVLDYQTPPANFETLLTSQCADFLLQ